MTKKAIPTWIPNRLLTVAECADVLRLSVRQTRRLISDGRLRVLRVGRRVLIPPNSIAALLDEGDRENTDKA